MIPLLLIAFGTFLLYAGGELLVRSVLRLARAFNTSPLIIGLTVVAFGTSSPELAVVIGAGITDRPAIALGNVLGSNIANLGLILAIAVLLRPIRAEAGFLKRDLPFMLVTSIVLLPMAWLGGLGRSVALILLALMALYLWKLFNSEEAPDEPALGGAAPGKLGPIVLALVALGLLIWGADLLVDSAVEVATGLGVSERVIGLTLVAFGTSLPEMAGCVAAAARRQGGIVLGNVIGSNIFNTLLVLPVGSLVRPIVASTSDLVDVGVMIAFTAVTFVFLFHRTRMYRFEGVVLLAGYAAYVGFLFYGRL